MYLRWKGQDNHAKTKESEKIIEGDGAVAHLFIPGFVFFDKKEMDVIERVAFFRSLDGIGSSDHLLAEQISGC